MLHIILQGLELKNFKWFNTFERRLHRVVGRDDTGERKQI